MSFASRVKESRKNNKLTQERLGELIGVAKSTIAGYENGTSRPDERKIIKLMSVLGVDANYLWQDDIQNEITPFPISPPEETFLKNYRKLSPEGRVYIDEHTRVLLEHEQTQQRKAVAASKEEYATDNVIEVNFKDLIEYDLAFSAGTGEFLDSNSYETIQVPINADTIKANFAVRVAGRSMEPRFYDGDTVLVKQQPAIEFGEIGIFIVNNNGYIKQLTPTCLKSLNPECEDVPIHEGDDMRTVGKVIGKL